MLDIVNIAHPAFIILGSYIAYIVNTDFGFDPILTAIVVMPAFYCARCREFIRSTIIVRKHGQESLRGLAFFFGLAVHHRSHAGPYFGVDYRLVEAPYIGPTLHFGDDRYSAADAWCRAWFRCS